MRFTIRDLLWLMVVVAMSAGWWAERRTTNERLRDYYSEIRGSEIDKELMERALLDFPDDETKIDFARDMAREWRAVRLAAAQKESPD